MQVLHSIFFLDNILVMRKSKYRLHEFKVRYFARDNFLFGT